MASKFLHPLGVDPACMEMPMVVLSEFVRDILMIKTHSRRHTLMAPRGYQFAGLSGSCAAWIDGLQIIITR